MLNLRRKGFDLFVAYLLYCWRPKPEWAARNAAQNAATMASMTAEQSEIFGGRELIPGVLAMPKRLSSARLVNTPS